jgi:hypothetical protein
VVAITHHQPPPVGVELISELLDVGGHLGLQRRGQHSTRALAHDLVYRRPRHTSRRASLSAPPSITLSMGRTFPPARQRRT